MDTELEFIPEDTIIRGEPCEVNNELYMGDGRDTNNKPSIVFDFYAEKTLINRRTVYQDWVDECVKVIL